jgi:hypothetical protein
VEADDRRFGLVYRTLDFKGRMRVGMLALLGRRAADPETAWLVSMFALQQLRLRWLRVVIGIALVGFSIWAFVQTRAPAALLVLQFSAGVLFLASLWTHSRAVRVNEPIARAPGAG